MLSSIRLHALGIDDLGFEQARSLVQHVVNQDGGIGQDYAFDRRMRDVALMPQRDVLEGCLRVRSDHAGQAADLFPVHRIALVRHGR